MPSPPDRPRSDGDSRGPRRAGVDRFLCDAMLAHLARWLRAAGYDAELALPEADDRALLDRARREGRTLLTCDRNLRGDGVDVLRLPMVDLPELARILREACGVDWLRAPFSRCLVDNAELEELADPAAAGVPPPARQLPGPFTRCPRCGRLFWPGSHVRRMRRRLERWRAADAASKGFPGESSVA